MKETAMDDGRKTVRGVILRQAGYTILAPVDGAGEVLRNVGFSEVGAAAMGFADLDEKMSFLERIRTDPKLALYGAFEVAQINAANQRPGHGFPSEIVGASELRPATEDEVRAAIRINLDRALERLAAQNVRPTMSAEALMELTRGGDHDEELPSPPSP
jgi:hypothetical protein